MRPVSVASHFAVLVVGTLGWEEGMHASAEMCTMCKGEQHVFAKAAKGEVL